MNKKKAGIFLALFLNVLFAGVFLGILYLMKDSKTASVYMNQIGIYANEENALENRTRVEALNLKTYTYTIDEMFVVVCCVYEDKALTIQEGDLLTSHQISFIEKQVTSTSSAFIQAIETKDIEKIMEMMKNKSS